MSELLVEVKRGPIVESRHYGDVAVVNRDGKLLEYVGDPFRVTYARSSAKPWQALPIVETGAADALQMSSRELALACASHSGEEEHVQLILAFLERIGVSPELLQCGAHPPYHAPSYETILRSGERVTAVHNNCSGKHTGMLALAKHLGADLTSYLEPDHPVQQLILQAVSDLTEVDKHDIAIGVDGCGVPVFGLPILRMAHAYAKLADPSGLSPERKAAVERIRSAMLAHPELVAGTDRFCTALMRAGQGLVLGKAGAEGVYCVGIPDAGIGIAVKVDDGNARAAYPAVVEILQQTGLVPEAVVQGLKAFHQPQVKNHKGTLVGSLTPVFTLHRAL